MAFQIGSLILAGLAIFARARLEASPWPLLRRLGLLSLAVWSTEEIGERLFDLRAFTPPLWLSLDRVPVWFVLWGALALQSARDISTSAWPGASRPLPAKTAAGALLWVAVESTCLEGSMKGAGLVKWSVPDTGLHFVGAPILVFLAWIALAGAAVWVLENAAYRAALRRWENATLPSRRWAWFRGQRGAARLLIAWELLAWPLPIVAAVVVGLAAHWGLLRWIPVRIPEEPIALLAALTAASMAAALVRSEVRLRVVPVLVWIRLPWWLGVIAAPWALGVGDPVTTACQIAFILPCIALIRWTPAWRVRRVVTLR